MTFRSPGSYLVFEGSFSGSVKQGKFENLEKLLQRALPLIEQLEKARKEEKAQN